MIRLKSLLNEGNEPLTGEWINKGVSLAKSLIARGFSKEMSAAIVGNMWAESTFNPTATNTNGAFGLLQWLGDRKTALTRFANNKKLNPNATKTQLDFIKYELLDSYDGKYAYEASQFKRADAEKSISGKAHAFAKFVERPGPAELSSTVAARKAAARTVYNVLIGNKPTTPTKPGKAASKTTSKTATKTASTKKIYTVKSGETLGGIANRNNTTVANILKKNPGVSADKIRIGQKLKI